MPSISYYTIPYHTIPYQTIPQYTVNITLLLTITMPYIILRYTKPYHTIVYHIILNHYHVIYRIILYAIFINGGHAKKQWDRVHESEAYEALLHCFPLFSCLISLTCMHLVPLFYACLPFMNMVYTTPYHTILHT